MVKPTVSRGSQTKQPKTCDTGMTAIPEVREMGCDPDDCDATQDEPEEEEDADEDPDWEVGSSTSEVQDVEEERQAEDIWYDIDSRQILIILYSFFDKLAEGGRGRGGGKEGKKVET